jgi:hypothetical protein
MAASNDDHGRSRRLGAEDRSRTIERSGDAVCYLHHAQGDEERVFLGLASKPRSMVSPSFASKPVASGFPIWASKPAAMAW